jgi:2-polyprenyl-3-methyl-5-hydroxy-6-metoxy-1,4-benzoquinol methylase
VSNEEHKEALDFTGERFTPECIREIWYEHMHRYAFAAPLCAGARVLDAACGEGYGSALLARRAAQVTGVDLSAQAVHHARERYGAISGLTFEEADCSALPFDDDSFDRIVSFETLEHLPGEETQEAMLAEFRRVLRPEGVLVISSPDKAIYSDKHGNDNAFHLRELYREELDELLGQQFPATHLFGQKLLFNSAIWDLEAGSGDAAGSESVQRVALQEAEGEQVRRLPNMTRDAMYFIALCAAKPELLPQPDAELWLLDDPEESVYSHYQGEIRRNMAAGGIIQERDLEIERLREALEQAQEQAQLPANSSGPFWRRIFGRGKTRGKIRR